MLGTLKRHPIRSAIVCLIALPFIVIATRGTLNYSGYCIAEGQWLSDEEKIRRVVQRMINRSQIPVATTSRGVQFYDQVKYESIDAFFAANPNCCKVGSDLIGGYTPRGFMDRVHGIYGDRVEVTAKLTYIGSDGEETSKTQTLYAEITNCGDIKD